MLVTGKVGIRFHALVYTDRRGSNGSSRPGRRAGAKEKPTSIGLGESLELDRSDWPRVDAMMDPDISRAIAQDPDRFTMDIE